MKKIFFAIIILFFYCNSNAQQPLETETAGLLKAKSIEWENTFEFQLSGEGTESAIPMALAYGISDYWEILVEPVFFTNISPKHGRSVNGLGDLEVTLSWNFIHEKKYCPGFAFAGEVKIPTAHSKLIGTGQTDYTATLLVSKKIGKFNIHLNGGHTFLGNPDTIKLNNIIDFAIATEFHVSKKFDLLAEFIGNTSSLPESADITGSTENNPNISSELSGGELVGMIGARYYFKPNFFIAIGVTYDNNNALLFRPGLTYIFNYKNE